MNKKFDKLVKDHSERFEYDFETTGKMTDNAAAAFPDGVKATNENSGTRNGAAVIDLAELVIPWLVNDVTKKHNTWYLIERLRRGDEVTPELASVIADVLEGKIKARPKKPKPAAHRLLVEGTIEHYKAELRGDMELEWAHELGVDGWKFMELLLHEAGYEGGLPEKKSEITKAAKLLACRRFGLTSSQLNELLSPRVARSKNR